mmetsp:Transcript_18888/g.52697  ORF Transcript_18888/g.52697 Transcript_18888/m.52697 type:complete len:424 (-) Transcript_18888:172-1443(-)|eukprot:CAMPEP_0117677482 /NCGR_PEP_ID=MMETSP0804-20121206/16770_1 /TAXON_ID=1074897 /ORGANISM="Tetraselmis astigmatica, Strain CCMP880" /LENGTH=423 /DNA_ID=CAMNT_0005486771 /DNA_START=345 /DNA_END=1616 /DNA_ORIENTATION=+
MGAGKPKASRAPAKRGPKVRPQTFSLRRKLCRIGVCTLDSEQYLEVMEELVQKCPGLGVLWNSERKRSAKPQGAGRKKTPPKPRQQKKPDLVNILKAHECRVLFQMLFGEELERLVEGILRKRKWARKHKDNEVMAEVLTVYWGRQKHPVTPEEVKTFFKRVGNQSTHPTKSFLATTLLHPFPPEVPGRKFMEESSALSTLFSMDSCCGKVVTDSDSEAENDDELGYHSDMEPQHLSQEELLSQDEMKLLPPKDFPESKPFTGLPCGAAATWVKEDNVKPPPHSNSIFSRLKPREDWYLDAKDQICKTDGAPMSSQDDQWLTKPEDMGLYSSDFYCLGSPKMEEFCSQDSLICSQPEVLSPSHLVKNEYTLKIDTEAVKQPPAVPRLCPGCDEDSASPQLVPLPEGRTTIEFVDSMIRSPWTF